MKVNDERMEMNKISDKILQNAISERGIQKVLKLMKENSKKNSINFIQKSYDNFKKDAKCAPYAGANDKMTNSLTNTILMNKNNLSIFEIEDDEIEYNIDFPLIPFDKFYIATHLTKIIGDEFYSINGFFVLNYDADSLCVIYYWSRSIKDGWAFRSALVSKDGLTRTRLKESCFVKDGEIYDGEFESKEIDLFAMKKFRHLMKKLIYKINKREYNAYKTYSHGNYEEKSIVFAHDVRSHKRHFWDDTGYFKIAEMNDEELKKRGYGRDNGLILKDGVLRTGIPFVVIAAFSTDEIKKEENKVYDLIEKRVFRQEEKLLKVLQEIFPNEFIKRHDRKVLKPLELDFLIRNFRLAFEYDGEQHFDKKLCEEVFKSDFDALKKRDRKKDKLCKKKNITLIRVKYDEPLTKTHIKKKIKEVNK